MSISDHSNLHGLVAFRLAGARFALPVEAVAEVVPIAELGHPPELPAVVEGLLNLAGEAVPVLRLDRLLGLAEGRYGLDASILVLKGQPRTALLVEHVDAVLAAADLVVLPVAADRSFNGCVAAQLEAGGGILHLLVPERLLLEEERLRLATFTQRTRERLLERWGDGA